MDFDTRATAFGGVIRSAWPQPQGFPGWDWGLVAGGARSVAIPPSFPAVTAISRSTDKLDIFFVGSDGNVWSAAWEPAFGEPWDWHGWWTIGS